MTDFTVPREAVATPEDVRATLALTDAQREELQKEQLKIYRSRARLTPEEQIIGRAIELERHHRITGNQDALAEAISAQGRFREAANIAIREDLKKVLLEKADAVEQPDIDCPCPTYTKHDDLHLPSQYVESNVIRDGKFTPAIRCKVCKTLNIMPILPHLAKLQAVRAQSVAGKETRADEYFRQPR